METLGERIKRLREDRGMTQGDLMRAAQKFIPEDKVFSRATLSRIENNKHRPNSWSLDAIATALGVRTDYLLDRTDHDTIPVPAPEIVGLVQALNGLPPRQRDIIVELVESALSLIAPLQIQPVAQLDRLDQLLERMPPERLPETHLVLEAWSAGLLWIDERDNVRNVLDRPPRAGETTAE